MSKKRKTELDVDPSAAMEPEPEPQPEPLKEEEPKEEEPKKLSKKKIIIIASGVAVLIVLIVVGFIFTEPEPPPKKEVQKEAELELPEPPSIKDIVPLINITFEPFILPFTQNGEEHFWQIAISLQLSSEDALDEMEHNLVIFREAIYLFLREKNKNDFLNPKKRKEILFNLKVLVDRSLQNGQVDRVLVTKFKVL